MTQPTLIQGLLSFVSLEHHKGFPQTPSKPWRILWAKRFFFLTFVLTSIRWIINVLSLLKIVYIREQAFPHGTLYQVGWPLSEFCTSWQNSPRTSRENRDPGENFPESSGGGRNPTSGMLSVSQDQHFVHVVFI